LTYDSACDEWIRKDPDNFGSAKIGEERERKRDDFLLGKGSFDVIYKFSLKNDGFIWVQIHKIN
jgi:hypothetical protein